MKILSRPPEDPTPTMNVAQMTVLLRNIMEVEGVATSDMYRKVLAIGAAAMLKQQELLQDYAVGVGGRGYYNIYVDVRMPDGEYATMVL